MMILLYKEFSVRQKSANDQQKHFVYKLQIIAELQTILMLLHCDVI